VGAGIIGLCAAEQLMLKGHEVTVVDRHPGDNCSYGNGGLVVPSHFVPICSPGMLRMGLKMMLRPSSPFGLAGFPTFETLAWLGLYVRRATAARVEAAGPVLAELNLASKAEFCDLMSRTGIRAGYETRGLNMVCRTEEGLREEKHLAEKAGRLGLETRVLSRQELVESEPGIDWSAAIKGGVRFMDDAHLTPGRFMSEFLVHLRAKGLSLINAAVTGFKTERSVISSARTEKGDVRADTFVLTAGAWSSSLYKLLGGKLPLLAGTGYGYAIPEEGDSLIRPAILTEERVAVTPTLDGIRFVGTLELGQAGNGINERRLGGMRRGIESCLPSMSAERLTRAKVWHGQRPCSPDGLPYLGPSRRFTNLVVGTGHAMMGMSLGPISGKILARCVCGEPPGFPLDSVAPDRYD
jgi:D-amino-acid dehydrogenase